MRKIIRKCAGCGSEYVGHKSRRYCSNECRAAHPHPAWNKGLSGYTTGKRTGVTKSCAWCGKLFYVKRCHASQMYCSNPCSKCGQFGGPGHVEKACAVCGAAFISRRSGDRKTCSKVCEKELRRRASCDRWSDAEMRERISSSLSAAAKRDPRRKKQLEEARTHRVFSAETRAKIRRGRLKQKFPTRATSIELALRRAFDALGLRFEVNVRMFGRWSPDFVFKDSLLVVQADGDYWHSLPSALKRDAAFNAAAESRGWTVLRFAEHEIKADLAACVKRVLDHLKQDDAPLLRLISGGAA